MSIKIAKIVSEVCEENGFIVYDDQNAKKECVFIDPGSDAEKFMNFAEMHGLTPAAILCTHGHADHILGVLELRARFPEAKIVIGAEDAVKLVNPRENLSLNFGFPLVTAVADVQLFKNGEETETVSYAGMEIEARHTPGHTRGHAVFWVKGCKPEVVFTGDLIFEESVGRTDFPDGDWDELVASIRRHVYTLPDDTVLYPGHGDATTVGREKKSNPYVRMG